MEEKNNIIFDECKRIRKWELSILLQECFCGLGCDATWFIMWNGM